MLTSYQFASNTPIAAIDLDGLECDVAVDKPTKTKPVISPVNGNDVAFINGPVIRGLQPVATESVTGIGWASKVASAVNSTLGRATGVVALLLSPQTMGNPKPYWIYQDNTRVNVATAHVERYTNDPRTLDDAYLQGVKQRLADGTASTQDRLYEREVLARPHRDGRKATYDKFSPNWESGSFRDALNKFAPGIVGSMSKDGVKTNYNNRETGVTIMYDNENNYFRIYRTDFDGTNRQ